MMKMFVRRYIEYYYTGEPIPKTSVKEITNEQLVNLIHPSTAIAFRVYEEIEEVRNYMSTDFTLRSGRIMMSEYDPINGSVIMNIADVLDAEGQSRLWHKMSLNDVFNVLMGPSGQIISMGKDDKNVSNQRRTTPARSGEKGSLHIQGPRKAAAHVDSPPGEPPHPGRTR